MKSNVATTVEFKVTNDHPQYLGLTESAQRFVRRFYEVEEEGNTAIGPNGNIIYLRTWEPRDRHSHIDCIREKVQTVQTDDTEPLVFTQLEAEYKCGVREEMFKWRRVEAFADNKATYDQKRGMLFT
jgi:hypothetical protein